MELTRRKIDFIRDFLKLTTEEAISELEDLLKKQLEVNFVGAEHIQRRGTGSQNFAV